MPLTALFCFFFFQTCCATDAKRTQRQIADHFRTELYFLIHPLTHNPQPITSKTCTPPQTCSQPLVPATDIDDPREIFIYVGLKTTSCGFFFFTPTMYTVVVLIIFQKVLTMVEVAGVSSPKSIRSPSLTMHIKHRKLVLMSFTRLRCIVSNYGTRTI